MILLTEEKKKIEKKREERKRERERKKRKSGDISATKMKPKK